MNKRQRKKRAMRNARAFIGAMHFEWRLAGGDCSLDVETILQRYSESRARGDAVMELLRHSRITQ